METIRLVYQPGGEIYGARPEDFEPYKQWDEVRQVARLSVDRFVKENAHYLTGRVLDYGAGKPGTCAKPEPYRDLIRGEYVSFDKGDHFPEGKFGAALCTQVAQYLPDVASALNVIHMNLEEDGALVMTYSVNWDEIETERWRFTRYGMSELLSMAGFKVLIHERLSEVVIDGKIRFPLMNGVVCRK